jgi:hypothetical protein
MRRALAALSLILCAACNAGPTNDNNQVETLIGVPPPILKPHPCRPGGTGCPDGTYCVLEGGQGTCVAQPPLNAVISCTTHILGRTCPKGTRCVGQGNASSSTGGDDSSTTTDDGSSSDSTSSAAAFPIANAADEPGPSPQPEPGICKPVQQGN